ncbi:sodium:solute symporter family protein [Methanohalophilus halophilus]|uniref:Sodium:proline symporter n=1 Tax=Methanohalophilus halophilus TaxID=2177 RepID=A0A1L3Q0S6_9EURY|nr:sodium:solute symporter family protein [Methanohalophilus halophilus]APH38477.1 sodium:proline symporter [Methanohalophilus halophilus]RNI10648.1 sodium:solute symporter family protein [Methanohalophilus halophilus]SDW09922.1 solute:Na+ symporter, SSS family [Methanohalophilus halophilus]
MESSQLFLILLAVYLAGLIGIGWYFTKKQNTVTDFWLAGRRIGTIGVGFSSAASWLTAGGLLAVIAFFMLQGMGSIWGFVAPNILALLIIAIFVKKIKNLPAITQAELLEQRYSAAIRAPIGIIITIVMILFAVADIKGFALVLEIFYGFDPLYAALIVALAVSVYVTLGGLSAVVWTDVVQFLFLSVFTIVIAIVAVGAATGGAVDTPANAGELFSNVSSGWWNPLSIGIPMVLIFLFAIVPGWITEQDPWQKVWAARDSKSARNGLLLGSLLITIVFAGCAVIAIALSSIYPEIPAAGFPMGMAQAEPALLVFVLENFSPLVIALSAIGLAAAAMSCTDTFATSGASCVSRDIYQRFIKPDATMKQMLAVNRLSVLFIVLAATVGSFFITSILEAIHIATYIASASYFFPLMGGLYWKRATKEGAMAGLIVGAVVQISLIVYDIYMTAPMAPAYLQTVHPILMNHGVIAGMGLSAVAFFGVSLFTKPSSAVNLAPFFKEEAKNLAAEAAVTVEDDDPKFQKFLKRIDEQLAGERAHLHVRLESSASVNWHRFVESLRSSYVAWVTPTGVDSVYRLVQSDMLSCVSITRGTTDKEIWFASEPPASEMGDQKKELYVAYNEVAAALESMGVFLTVVEE